MITEAKDLQRIVPRMSIMKDYRQSMANLAKLRSLFGLGGASRLRDHSDLLQVVQSYVAAIGLV